MRNPADSLTTNHNLIIDDIEKFFESKPTIENIMRFFSQGFPTALLEADHFINLLKRRALWDETGACRMIDCASPYLPDIIRDKRALKLFFHTLSKNVLSHLFFKADFISHRFFNHIAAIRTWLLDDKSSSDHRVFLLTFYQRHFIRLLQSQPFTPGILSTLLSFFGNVDEKHNPFIKEIIRFIKPSIINLFFTPDRLPGLRYILLSTVNSDEFTFLIREIPEIFELLCNIENPKFFPLIQFEKLSPGQRISIQIQLIQNLIDYYEQQKAYPAFFTPTHHAQDNHFISEIKKSINQSEKNQAEKIVEIQKMIDAYGASLSTYIQKLLEDRQLSANTLYRLKSLSGYTL